jgi:hypothetical protein
MKQNTTKTCNRVELHSFLTSIWDGEQWSVSHPVHFAPGEIALGTCSIGGWVRARAGLEAAANNTRNISCPCQKSNPGRSARSLITVPSYNRMAHFRFLVFFHFSWKSVTGLCTYFVSRVFPNLSPGRFFTDKSTQRNIHEDKPINIWRGYVTLHS